MKRIFTTIYILFIAVNGFSTTWNVGPTHTYTKPSQVCALVASGDSVLIDAGVYNGDTAQWTANNLVIIGTGGMAWMNSGGHVYGDKGIWNVNGKNTVVANIEFSGAVADPASKNGAGIRMQGSGLSVVHCSFHDNEDGILTGADSTSDILIEYCEFNHNGHGDGFSHNLYIGHVRQLTFQFNYTHHAIVGHELKSRASKNYILYNRFSDEDTGTASRDIDLPNGGLAILIGNVIEKGPMAPNNNVIEYGLEGLINTDSSLYIVNNTFVSDKSGSVSFIQIQNGISLLKVYNNAFAGTGTFLTGNAASTDTSHNWFGSKATAEFLDTVQYNYDIDLISPLISRGIDPGLAGLFSLTPVFEYLHPASSTGRFGSWHDVGAFGLAPDEVKEVKNSDADLIIWPNPSNGNFSVLIKGYTGKVSYELVDLNGSAIIEQEEINGGKPTILLNDKLPNGLYLVKASFDNYNLTRLIVISH